MDPFGSLDSAAIIRSALEQPTLAKEMLENPAVDGSFVARRVMEATPDIRSQATPEIEAWEVAKTAHFKSIADAKARSAPPFYVVLTQALPGLAIGFAVLGAIVWWLTGWLAPAKLRAFRTWFGAWSASWEPLSGRWVAIGLVAVLVSLLAGTVWWWNTVRGPLRARAHVAAGVNSFRDAVTAAADHAEGALFRAATQMALSIINDASAPFFQSDLQLNDAPTGLKKTSDEWLSEVSSSVTEVPTEARRLVVGLMKRLPGMALGISGPRGAGKSTLLRSISEAPPVWDEKPAVVISTSAPVEYDGREFLLHLYGSLCRVLFDRLGISEDRALQQGSEALRGRGASQLRVGWVIIGCGLALGIAAFMLTAMLQSIPPVREHVPLTSDQRVLQILDLKTGTLFIWAFGALLGGLLVVVTSPIPDDAEARGSTLFRIVRRLGRSPLRLWHRPLDMTSFAERCIKEYADIRFQRTYTTGWSGTLTMPAAATFGRSQGLSMAETARSLPELVQRFRSLAADAATDVGRVIICIDELDKLKSADLAYQFIDEVKSIFNIPHTYYLVSVSENAISNFDRRGMPFRDAFDSAFDDMLYVDYLSLDGSRQLINRRVLNWPGPFLCLCHVLSGGLPRDLIRTTRKVVDLAREGQHGTSIATLSAHLFRTELREKCRAISIAAREVRLEPELTGFLVKVAQVEALDPVTGALPAPLSLTIDTREDLTDEERVAHRRLTGLAIELAAFIQFSFTAAPIFEKFNREKAWRTAIDKGLIDHLTAARQALEFGVGVALFRTAEIRKGQGMAHLDFNVPSVAAADRAVAAKPARTRKRAAARPSRGRAPGATT